MFFLRFQYLHNHLYELRDVGIIEMFLCRFEKRCFVGLQKQPMPNLLLLAKVAVRMVFGVRDHAFADFEFLEVALDAAQFEV